MSCISPCLAPLLLGLADDDGDDNGEDGADGATDDELHLHVLPPHLVLELVGVALEHAGLLLQFLSLFLDALKFDAVLQGDIDVLLHDQLHALYLASHRCELVHLGQVVILGAQFLQHGGAELVQGAVAGGSGLVAGFGDEL